MLKSRWSAALLIIWLGGTAVSASEAKPSGLPANQDVRCPEACEEPGELPIELGLQCPMTLQTQVAIEQQTQSDVGAAPICLDLWCPSVLPLLVQRICERFLAIGQQAVAQPHGDAGQRDPMFAATAEQARQLYEIAARCAREGNLEQARACLRQAHLANPTCRFGRLAIERLQELEATESGAETGEPRPESPRPPMTGTPPLDEEPQSDDEEMSEAERAFRRVREMTQPLGLVRSATY